MHMKGISALYVAESRPTVLPSSGPATHGSLPRQLRSTVSSDRTSRNSSAYIAAAGRTSASRTRSAASCRCLGEADGRQVDLRAEEHVGGEPIAAEPRVRAAEDGSHESGAPEQREHEPPLAQARAPRPKRINRVEQHNMSLFHFVRELARGCCAQPQARKRGWWCRVAGCRRRLP